MTVRVRAGIDVHGTVLRYAELEQRASRYRLLRLGSFNFDFDVAAAIREAAHPEHLDALSDALGQAFGPSTATRLHVVVHPPHSYSFFTPLPGGADKEDRKQRLLREAALLTRSRTPHPLRLTADPLYPETLDDENTVEWYHVLALHERMHIRLDRLLRPLPPAHFRVMLSMHAVANAIGRLEQRTDASAPREAPFTLAVGWYPTHVEYVLCRNGHWHFSLYTDAEPPTDCAYFALLLIQRLHLTPDEVGQLYVYGTPRPLDDFASMQESFALAPEWLDPLRLVDVDADQFTPADDLSAYVPCLGAVL